jgi:hypothetical protein
VKNAEIKLNEVQKESRVKIKSKLNFILAKGGP